MFILKISQARPPDLKAFSRYPDLGPTYHFNADPDLILFDADPNFHHDADPDLDPSLQIKA
jgi:hypothetical protein